MKEFFYKGDKIIQYGTTDFSAFAIDMKSCDIVEFHTSSLEKAQEKLDNFHKNH